MIIGSPPQVQGKALNSDAFFGTLRITPASAGKSKNRPYKYIIYKDHPRKCGEKLAEMPCTVRLKGSPPQVRGKEIKKKFANLGGGITPASAGKSETVKYILFSHRDHPRKCGEKCNCFF